MLHRYNLNVIHFRCIHAYRFSLAQCRITIVLKVFVISHQLSDQIESESQLCIIISTFKFVHGWHIMSEMLLFLFQGRQGDQIHGLLTARKEGSSPQKWGNPKSIFQALFAFLL